MNTVLGLQSIAVGNAKSSDELTSWFSICCSCTSDSETCTCYCTEECRTTVSCDPLTTTI